MELSSGSAFVPQLHASLPWQPVALSSRRRSSLLGRAHWQGAAASTVGFVAAAWRGTRRRTSQCARASRVLDAVVVGAGVSGLAAAFKIAKEAPSSAVVVTEAGDRVGGNVSTRTANGRLWEEGPNTFMPNDAILSTACDVGLRKDIQLADPAAYRFVWWDGRLRALPANVMDAVFGDFLSLPGKIRAGLGAAGLKDPLPETEESVRDFVTRNLGEEAFERLIDPFVSGVFAGDPSALSAEAATGRVQILEKESGSLLAGAINFLLNQAGDKSPRDPRLPTVEGQTVGSFRGGLRQFVEALSDHVGANEPVRLNWKLTKMEWDSELEEHRLEYDTPDGIQVLRSRSVVLTAPAYVTASLLKPLSESAADALAEIKYPRVAAVTVEYPRSAFREQSHGKGIVNGFGQLHPRSTGIRTLGTIYSSSLFPNRVPDPDKVMLLHYIGGARDSELHGGIDNLSEGQLVEATHRDALTTLLRPWADVPDVLGVKVWSHAIPQCNIGHNQRLERAQAGLEAAGVKRLFLAGNYVGGVAFGRCVEYGLEIGEKVLQVDTEYQRDP